MLKIFTKDEVIALAHEILNDRYPNFLYAFAAGSIISGCGTYMSDLDITIVLDKVDAAYRESFTVKNLPIEAFVHEAETLQAFISNDYDHRHAAMIDMIAHGVLIPADQPEGLRAQEYADGLMSKPLPVTPDADMEKLRYVISDGIDDLKGERLIIEQRAILYKIYPVMGELYMRHYGHFIPSGKRLPRVWKEIDPDFFDRLDNVMINAHTDGITAEDVETLENLLDDLGGYIFDGYKSEAPADKRKKPLWKDV